MVRPALLSAPLFLGLLALGPVAAGPLPPPPPPVPDGTVGLPWAPERRPVAPDSDPGDPELAGDRIVINGLAQRAQWRWQGPPGIAPTRLWLPLEVLQERIGVTSRALAGTGDLELEWFGRRLLVRVGQQRSLGDEVAIDAVPLLASTGLLADTSGASLNLRLPPPRLLRARPSAASPGRRRVVLDLSGPALLRGREGDLVLEVSGPETAQASLRELGVRTATDPSGLRLKLERQDNGSRIFSLGDPPRLVIDLASSSAAAAPPAVEPAPAMDPRLVERLGRSIRWDRMDLWVGGRRVRINAVGIDPTGSDLELRPLSRADGMEGLSSLAGLARRRDALVAINGGFFNRIRRLPLGALRDRGQWLSGPILNRGAIGWDPGALPRFGRLRLEEVVVDRLGNRWPLTALNSGYVQRGISRYTAAWGRTYRSLVPDEQAVLLRGGRVVSRFGAAQLAGGVPVSAGDDLLVGRAGAMLPWPEGESLSLESSVSSPLGLASSVVGGGPLLRQDGQLVLDGLSEGFSPAFLSQGAPRTVVGSDGRQLWLVTLEGVNDEGPTLRETAELMGRLGLRDALNLDGGSSTGLVMGGRLTVKGRGVEGAIHHGLGLVPGAGRTPVAPGG